MVTDHLLVVPFISALAAKLQLKWCDRDILAARRWHRLFFVCRMSPDLSGLVHLPPRRAPARRHARTCATLSLQSLEAEFKHLRHWRQPVQHALPSSGLPHPSRLVSGQPNGASSAAIKQRIKVLGSCYRALLEQRFPNPVHMTLLPPGIPCSCICYREAEGRHQMHQGILKHMP